METTFAVQINRNTNDSEFDYDSWSKTAVFAKFDTLEEVARFVRILTKNISQDDFFYRMQHGYKNSPDTVLNVCAISNDLRLHFWEHEKGEKSYRELQNDNVKLLGSLLF